MAKYICSLLFAMLLGCATAENMPNSSQKAKFCSEYDWDDLQTLVQPYLDNMLYTSLVMQVQSSAYNPSAAASHVLGMKIGLPDEISRMLLSIRDANCNRAKSTKKRNGKGGHLFILR